MRLSLFRPRLPFLIFIIIILVSSIIGYAIINSSIATHTSVLRGDYFRLKTDYLEVDFPKSWYSGKAENINQTFGNRYIVYLAPIYLRAVVFFRIYDEKATQSFSYEHNITNMFSINSFEINQLFNSALAENINATLSIIENSTITVSTHEASYVVVDIKNGLKDNDVYYNLTGIFISLIKQGNNGKIIKQIIFYGEENDWNQTRDTFMIILNSIKI